MNTSQIIITLLFFIGMLPGIAGVLLPALPGIPYMFLVALVYAAICRFQFIGINDLLILGAIAVLSLIVDYGSGALGAKLGGASPNSVYAGLAGLVAGLILFPPFGGILGLFACIYIFETIKNRGHRQAIRAAKGSLIGSLAGVIINLSLALLFMAIFLWSVFF